MDHRSIAGKIMTRGPRVSHKFENVQLEFECNLICVSEVSVRLKGKHARLDSTAEASVFPETSIQLRIRPEGDAEGEAGCDEQPGVGRTNPRGVTNRESGKTEDRGR